jgi:hypothetical protein
MSIHAGTHRAPHLSQEPRRPWYRARQSVRAWLDHICGPAPLVPGLSLLARSRRPVLVPAPAAPPPPVIPPCGFCLPGSPCLDHETVLDIAHRYNAVYDELKMREQLAKERVAAFAAAAADRARRAAMAGKPS